MTRELWSFRGVQGLHCSGDHRRYRANEQRLCFECIKFPFCGEWRSLICTVESCLPPLLPPVQYHVHPCANGTWPRNSGRRCGEEGVTAAPLPLPGRRGALPLWLVNNPLHRGNQPPMEEWASCKRLVRGAFFEFLFTRGEQLLSLHTNSYGVVARIIPRLSQSPIQVGTSGTRAWAG